MQPPQPQETTTSPPSQEITKSVEDSERAADSDPNPSRGVEAEKGPDADKVDAAKEGESEKDGHTVEAPEIVTSGPSSPPLHPLHGADDDEDSHYTAGEHSDKEHHHDMLETTSPADLSDLSPVQRSEEPSAPVSDAEVEDANSEVNLSSNEELEEGAEMEEDEKDESNYVGETTWEERTWREIVKLRENMFWARVGGVR